MLWRVTSDALFLVIFLSIVAGQVLLVELGGLALRVVPLSAFHWAFCAAVGFSSLVIQLPISAVARLFLRPAAVKQSPLLVPLVSEASGSQEVMLQPQHPHLRSVARAVLFSVRLKRGREVRNSIRKTLILVYLNVSTSELSPFCWLRTYPCVY